MITYQFLICFNSLKFINMRVGQIFDLNKIKCSKFEFICKNFINQIGMDIKLKVNKFIKY